MQLTFADRDLFLNTLDALLKGWSGDDRSLLADVAAWVSKLRPQFGFEECLTRDLVALSRYLIDDGIDKTSREVARGGLLYALQAEQTSNDKLAAFGLLDDSFVASYCVHEIQSRLGQESQYSPPRLLPAERQRAEEMFLSFHGQDGMADSELIEASRKTVGALGILGECGIFRRLRKNVEYLSQVLSDSDAQSDHRECARAALKYLICEQDALGDDLGLVGFLDDNFIVQTAVELIEPSRDPWLDLLDGTVAAWPFLNAVILGENGWVQRLSEFMLVNVALVCPALRKTDAGSHSVILSPRVGPIPFLVGMVRAIALAHEASRSSAEPMFRPGQKVLVDYETVREFKGTTTYNGREFILLERSATPGGKRGTRIDYLPLRDLHRLTPAPSRKATRGELLRESERAIHALEQIFVGTNSLRGVGSRQVIVATDIGKAKDLASTLLLHGHPLHDVIPMGHLSASGEITTWSSRFGSQQPLLLFSYDVDHACEQIESGAATDLVVVDGASRNASRAASVARIAGMGTRVLTIVPTAQGDSDNDSDSMVWEWTDDDLSLLLWPDARPSGESGPVTAFEQLVYRGIHRELDVRVIQHAASRAAFESLDALKRAAEERGEDRLSELDDAVGAGFGILTRMLRFPLPFGSWPGFTEEAEAVIGRVQTLSGGSFVSDAERKRLREACEGLRGLLDDGRTSSEKANVVKSLVESGAGVVVICAGRNASMAASEGGLPVIAHDRLASGSELSGGAVVPGWFGRQTMTNMLVPPIATPLTLVLFDLEAEWYSGFVTWRRRIATARSKRSDRSRIFPEVKGWKRPASPTVTVSVRDEEAYSKFEAIQERVWEDRRHRLVRESGSDGVEHNVRAKLVFFDGGYYAFLSESYRAKLATHLLQETESREADAELQLVRVEELRVGDALLFRRGTDSDVLRVLADALLPPGTRATSAAWKRALREYMDSHYLSADGVWRRLQAAGCPIGAQAVHNWVYDDDLIAPLAYQRDVATIAGMTGDAALNNSLDACIEAIGQVRGAHLRASHVIAGKVVARAVAALKEGEADASTLEIGDDVVLVRISAIDKDWAQIRSSVVNSLQGGLA